MGHSMKIVLYNALSNLTALRKLLNSDSCTGFPKEYVSHLYQNNSLRFETLYDYIVPNVIYTVKGKQYKLTMVGDDLCMTPIY